jgi:hypothetical protein
MILSRYCYRPVTVPLPFLASVTYRPSPFHHRDTPVPNRPSLPYRPSLSFTVLRRPLPSFTVPHRPSPSLTVPHRPSPSLTVPHRPSPSLTVPHRPTPFQTVPRRGKMFIFFLKVSAHIRDADHERA